MQDWPGNTPDNNQTRAQIAIRKYEDQKTHRNPTKIKPVSLAIIRDRLPILVIHKIIQPLG